jgi:hypothetical protein
VIFLLFLLNFAITLFLAKKFVIPNDKISIPIIFKSLVLGGALGTFVFLYLNATFAKPLPVETYKIKSFWKDFGSDRGKAYFNGYVVDLEKDAYKDDPAIRTFEFKPDAKYASFNFEDGLFGIKVLKEKKLENEKSKNLPGNTNDLTHRVDSLLINKDTAGIRILFEEMQGDK